MIGALAYRSTDSPIRSTSTTICGPLIEWLRCWGWGCRYRFQGGLKVERHPISNKVRSGDWRFGLGYAYRVRQRGLVEQVALLIEGHLIGLGVAHDVGGPRHDHALARLRVPDERADNTGFTGNWGDFGVKWLLLAAF